MTNSKNNNFENEEKRTRISSEYLTIQGSLVRITGMCSVFGGEEEVKKKRPSEEFVENVFRLFRGIDCDKMEDGKFTKEDLSISPSIMRKVLFWARKIKEEKDGK